MTSSQPPPPPPPRPPGGPSDPGEPSDPGGASDPGSPSNPGGPAEPSGATGHGGPAPARPDWGPPQPGTAVGPAGAGWYSGPIPIAGLAPRETFGSAIGRTLVKSLTVLAVLAIGAILIPVLLVGMLVAVAGGPDASVAPGLGTSPRTVVAGTAGGDIRLAAVPITGLILGEDRGEGGSLFGALNVTYGYSVKEELAALAEDPSIDGVILEIDSPGGTIFGSKAIADGVAAYRETTGNPVVAHVGGISASGGLYAMAGSSTIYADHGTLIGSIGVIFGPFQRYDDVTAIDGGILGGGVTTEGGIEVEYLTAGRGKDLGNPYRPMTTEERAVLQEGLDDAYAEFVAHVSQGRDLPEAEIEKDLGALLFGEQQAVANGLIDGVANRDDSYLMAAEAAGLEDGQTWVVERIDTPEIGLLDLLVGADGDEAKGGSDAAGTGTGLASTHPLCLGTGTILAYHGDPAGLCAWGR